MVVASSHPSFNHSTHIACSPAFRDSSTPGAVGVALDYAVTADGDTLIWFVYSSPRRYFLLNSPTLTSPSFSPRVYNKYHHNVSALMLQCPFLHSPHTLVLTLYHLSDLQCWANFIS